MTNPPYPRPGNGQTARRGHARQPGRDIEIWRAYCEGNTQEAIARRYTITQSSVSRAIDRVRESLPREDREALVRREVEFLNAMRAEMMADFHAALPPAFDKDGNALIDPDTGELVRDKAARFAAWDRAVKSAERLAKLLGLDAPSRVEASGAVVTYVLVDVDDEALR